MEYRDATYSAETQERLRALLARLTQQDGWNEAESGVHALADVIVRWDANETTAFEITEPDPGVVVDIEDAEEAT